MSACETCVNVTATTIALGLIGGAEVGILCLVGGAPLIPAALLVTVKAVAGMFFTAAGDAMLSQRNACGLASYTVTTLIGVGISVAFIVAAVSMGVIGPLGIGIYASLTGLGIIYASAKLLCAAAHAA